MSLSTALHRRLAAGLLTAVALTALAACGNKDDGSGTANTPAGGNATNGPGGRGGGAMSAYFQCLQENGVTMSRPSGAPGADGTRPSGAPGGNGGPGGDGTPPSGGPGGNGPRPSGGPGGGGGRQITKPDGVSDETWTKATEACASLAPAPAASS